MASRMSWRPCAICAASWVSACACGMRSTDRPVGGAGCCLSRRAGTSFIMPLTAAWDAMSVVRLP
jgi:hypothetical protein